MLLNLLPKLSNSECVAVELFIDWDKIDVCMCDGYLS